MNWVWMSSRGLCALALLCLGVAGSACHRTIGAVGSKGSADVYEHGEVKRLGYVIVQYTAPLLGAHEVFLSESVPHVDDKHALRRLVNDSPPYRTEAAIRQAIDSVTTSTGYPWACRMHWVLGTDPLVLGVGDLQGAMDRRDPDATLFPFVRSDSEGEMIHALVVFEMSPWRWLRERRRWESAQSRSWRLVELPQPMTTRAAIAQLERYTADSSQRGNRAPMPN